MKKLIPFLPVLFLLVATGFTVRQDEEQAVVGIEMPDQVRHDGKRCRIKSGMTGRYLFHHPSRFARKIRSRESTRQPSMSQRPAPAAKRIGTKVMSRISTGAQGR